MASVPNEIRRLGAQTHVHCRTAHRLSTTKYFVAHSGVEHRALRSQSLCNCEHNSRAYLYAYMHIILVIKSKHSIIAKHKQYIRTNTTKLHALRYWALAVTNVNKFQ